ncbi:MAG: hypothetical protein N3E39_00420 [Candidatus Methanomethylicia archaeon]|nr:hypothetical protein [Candidatus Methanomethylicia archaeon]
MNIAIFDLDGVIANVEERLKKVLEKVNKKSINEISRYEKRKFWNEFLNPRLLILDKPNTEIINHIKKLKDEGFKIIILTGRSEDKQKNETIKQLNLWGVPYDEIYFRSKKDFRKDSIYKKSVIKKLLNKGYKVVEFWEDSEEVIKGVRKLIPEAKIVKVGA